MNTYYTGKLGQYQYFQRNYYKTVDKLRKNVIIIFVVEYILSTSKVSQFFHNLFQYFVCFQSKIRSRRQLEQVYARNMSEKSR